MAKRAGTLTFLFTDIEDHTALWDAHAEAMSTALQDHDALIVTTVATAGGEVVKTSGDGAMIVFPDAGQAVEAAVSLQRELAAREWPGIGALRVRMGLHTGVAEVRDGDYFGPEVIRAARLCDAAHGGQIVASRAVAELARDREWIDLGQHRLRGLGERIEVRQVVAEGLADRFPSLRTLDGHPNTLPRFRTAFFGREDEIAEVADLLAAHRLVTLTGVGGSGKTRLAVEVAHACLSSYPDGVYFTDLSLVTDGERVWDAVASALELRPPAGPGGAESRRDGVLRFLAGRRALLVLDNCEHVLDAAADVVDEILDAADDVRVVATSREGLHVEGEHMVQVPSLAVDTDAVSLLRDRAAAAGSGSIDDDVAIHICQRLDGLPLAIELVAARCGQLGAAEVSTRLSDRFRLLTGGRRRVARQRTLEATLDWSHDLLAPEEQAVLRRMAVFTGSCSLAAVEAVAGSGVDVVASLVDKSLVQPAAGGRFRLLETVRAYAEDRLADSGESDLTRQALVRWLIAQLEVLPDEQLLADSTPLDSFVTDELENICAALTWAGDRGDWESVVRIAIPVACCVWETADEAILPVIHGLWHALDAGIDGELRHRALAGHTLVAWAGGGVARADLWTEAAASSWDRDDALSAQMLTFTANVLDAWSRVTGDEAGLERARQLLARAATIAAPHGPFFQSGPMYIEGVLALNGTDWERAAERLETAAQLITRSGRPLRFFEWTLYAVARLGAGRPVDRPDPSLFQRGPRSPDRVPGFEAVLDALSAPDPSRPRRPLVVDRRAIDRVPRTSANTLIIAVAALAARERDWPAAARLLAAGRGDGRVFAAPAGVALYRLTVPEVRAALDKPTRDALMAEGRAMGLAGGLDLAVDWLATA